MVLIPVKEIEVSSWSLDPDGTWFNCDHEFATVEDDEVDTMTNGEHDTYINKAYWCDDCQQWLDWEVDHEPPELEREED